MKSKRSASQFPTRKRDWKKAIARAPKRVEDRESPYHPNDRNAVRAFWAKGTVRYPGQRGPQRSPTKVLVSLRLSRETRIDETLKSAIETKAV